VGILNRLNIMMCPMWWCCSEVPDHINMMCAVWMLLLWGSWADYNVSADAVRILKRLTIMMWSS
jgi:hypothetical protein